MLKVHSRGTAAYIAEPPKKIHKIMGSRFMSWFD